MPCFWAGLCSRSLLIARRWNQGFEASFPWFVHETEGLAGALVGGWLLVALNSVARAEGFRRRAARGCAVGVACALPFVTLLVRGSDLPFAMGSLMVCVSTAILFAVAYGSGADFTRSAPWTGPMADRVRAALESIGVERPVLRIGFGDTAIDSGPIGPRTFLLGESQVERLEVSQIEALARSAGLRARWGRSLPALFTTSVTATGLGAVAGPTADSFLAFVGAGSALLFSSVAAQHVSFFLADRSTVRQDREGLLDALRLRAGAETLPANVDPVVIWFESFFTRPSFRARVSVIEPRLCVRVGPVRFPGWTVVWAAVCFPAIALPIGSLLALGIRGAGELGSLGEASLAFSAAAFVAATLARVSAADRIFFAQNRVRYSRWAMLGPAATVVLWAVVYEATVAAVASGRVHILYGLLRGLFWAFFGGFFFWFVPRANALMRSAGDLAVELADEMRLLEEDRLDELAARWESQGREPSVTAAELLLFRGNAQGAAAMLESLAKKYPGSRDVASTYAAALVRAGRPRDALAGLRRAIERHGDTPELIAWLYFAALDGGGNVEDIERRVERVLHASPDDPILGLANARRLARTGSSTAAHELAQTSLIQMESEFIPAWARLYRTHAERLGLA